jgi:hypothetical protein
MTQRVLGSTVSLWRYPVKSMMGQMAPSLVVSNLTSTKYSRKCSTVMKFSALAEVHGATAGDTGRISKASRKLTYGSFVEYQQVDSGDGKNIEVVTDES